MSELYFNYIQPQLWISLVLVVAILASLTFVVAKKYIAMKRGLRLAFGKKVPDPLFNFQNFLFAVRSNLLLKSAKVNLDVSDFKSKSTSASAAASCSINKFEEIAERIILALLQNFKIKTAALAFRLDSSTALVVRGQAAKTIEPELRVYLRNHLNTVGSYGLRDEHLVSSLFSSYACYGFGYTYTLPVPVYAGTLVLWCGFDRSNCPSNQQLADIKQASLKIAKDFDADIVFTDLKGRAELAEAHNQERSEYLAYLSHDMRSPLHNIKSILSILKIENLDNSNTSFIDAAIQNCVSLEDLVCDVLDLAKHRAGKLTAEAADFKISKLAAEVISNFEQQAAAKKIALEFTVDGDDQIYADRRQVRRILSNLLSNAIKYTKIGKVVVKIYKDLPETLSVSIIDSGCGLSLEQQHKLFTPFTRFSSQAEQGVGLGLALTKILVELNHAKLVVNSEPSKGSEFKVVFPLAKMKSNPQLSRGYFGTDSVDNSKMQVLIIEDDFDCASTLANAFKRNNFVVNTSHSMSEALNLINYAAPNLIVTDAHIPDGNVAKLVKMMDKRGVSIPFIVLSGDCGKNKRQEYLALGASAIFEKPADLSGLIEVAQNCVEQKVRIGVV